MIAVYHKHEKKGYRASPGAPDISMAEARGFTVRFGKNERKTRRG
jgi:hypothetical protein